MSEILKYIDVLYAIFCKQVTNIFFPLENNSYVAMFHDITKSKTEDKYAVTIDEYEKYIKSLLKKKNIVTNIKECYLENENVLITFDDGYTSIMKYVLPVMKKYKLPFTVFLVTDFIGKDGYLDEEDILELMESGLCTIGSHAKTHRMFRKLNKAEKRKELKESKKKLESIIEKEVTDFAFPYGSFYAVDGTSRRMAACYYQNVYVTTSFTLNRKRRYVPRINIPYYIQKCDLICREYC